MKAVATTEHTSVLYQNLPKSNFATAVGWDAPCCALFGCGGCSVLVFAALPGMALTTVEGSKNPARITSTL